MIVWFCYLSGRVLDVSEARERYRKESTNPVMVRNKRNFTSVYFFQLLVVILRPFMDVKFEEFDFQHCVPTAVLYCIETIEHLISGT